MTDKNKAKLNLEKLYAELERTALPEMEIGENPKKIKRPKFSKEEIDEARRVIRENTRDFYGDVTI